MSILQTQRNFFKGDEVGAGPNSGVGFPNFERLSYGFDIPYIRCDKHEDMKRSINDALNKVGPVLCEIIIDEMVPFSPKLASKQMSDGKITSPPLEDLAPFLSKEELASNMLIQDNEILKMKKELTQIYVNHNTAGKTYDELAADMERDNFMSAEEAVAYGLADRIITKR